MAKRNNSVKKNVSTTDLNKVEKSNIMKNKKIQDRKVNANILNLTKTVYVW